MMISQRQRSVRRIALIILLITAKVASPADEKTRFRSNKEFETSLAEVTRVSSISIPLKAQLNDLIQSSGLAIHRDRRIDPRTPISLETDFVPRIQVLARISETIPETSICIHENLVIFGPSPQVHRLPIMVDQARQSVREIGRLTSGSAEKMLVPKWNMLAEPRQLLVDAAAASGLRFSNPEAIPHDVWEAGALPSMHFSSYAAIVLNEFDLMLLTDASKRALTVSAIPTHQKFTHRYVVGTSLKAAVEDASKAEMPNIIAKWTAAAAEITGTIDEHAAFHKLLTSLQYQSRKGARTSNPSLRKMAFQLQEGQMTARQLIEQLQKQRLVIEVKNAESSAAKTALSTQIHIEAMSKPIPAARFFETLFGELFEVELLDDKVLLIAK